MSMNLSLNKVRVTKLFGDDSAVQGLMDPIVGMEVRIQSFGSGVIMGAQGASGLGFDAEQVIVSMGTSSGLIYPHELLVDYVNATGVPYGCFPTGVGCVQFGHSTGMFAGGVGSPNAIGTGMAYIDGGGTVHLFNRHSYD